MQVDEQACRTWLPRCPRHSDESDLAWQGHGDDNGGTTGEPDLKVDPGDAQDGDADDGWNSDDDGSEESYGRGGRPLTLRRRLHQRIQEALQRCIPRNETELSNYLYQQGDDIILHPDYPRDSRILLDAFHHSFLAKTWDEILAMTPEGYFDKKECYLPVEESVEWLHRILEFNAIDPKDFVTKVHNVMNKSLPKRNAILILGAPNAGKTLVAESITASAIISETLSTFNGKSSFEFQPMLMKRAVLLNEPKITDGTVELLKNVLEGATVSIDAKYKSGQALSRTPIVIASNQNLTYYTTARTTNLVAFQARCYQFDLRPFEDLAQCAGKLHPYMWQSLISRYAV